ncbi:MAG: cation:proton antiporter, partial [Ignavibacteriaceae bacterium]
MTPVIVFLLILILGYISTNLIFSKIQSRYYVPSGIEYIFLGIIIGPAFSNWIAKTFEISYPQIITNDVLLQLSPGISAAIGFIGLTYGLKFKFKDFTHVQPEHYRLVFTDILISIILIGGVSFGLFYLLFFDGKNLLEIIAASYALSVMGGVTSHFLIKTVINRYEAKGKIASALKNSSVLNVNFNIFIYGILFSVIHFGASEALRLTPTEWIVISIMLALIIGVLFFIFVGREQDENKLFVAVLGIAIFTSGVAYFLNFSPLYMSFFLGVILTNLSRISHKIEASLTRLLHPFGILIVIMAGFYWVPPSLLIFIISVLAFIILRFYSKKLSGFAAYKTSYDKDKLNPEIGRGLFSSDIIVAAMIVDYINVYQNQFTPIVVSCVLSALIFYGI